MTTRQARASSTHSGDTSLPTGSGKPDRRRQSEDFGSFGTEWRVPSVFWFVGGTDPDTYAKAKEAGRINDLPVNHSPQFAPVIHPTLETGVQTLVVAAQAWLAAA